MSSSSLTSSPPPNIEAQSTERSSGNDNLLLVLKKIFSQLKKDFSRLTGAAAGSGAVLPAQDTPNKPDRFQLAVQRVRNHKYYRPSLSEDQPYGTFRGRHIIGEQTKINGGVYLGIQDQEALVVDEKYGALPDIYSQLIVRYLKNNGEEEVSDINEEEIFQEIISLCKEKLLRLPEHQVRRVVDKKEAKPDRKVALDMYLKYRVGTDRHLTLLAAYLIERLIKKGLIKGQLYLDSSVPSSGSGKERLVFASSSGRLYIFSPSQI